MRNVQNIADILVDPVITTDRRDYNVQLTSTVSTAMTGMRWTYPQDELLALTCQRVEAEAARPVSVGVEIAPLNFE